MSILTASNRSQRCPVGPLCGVVIANELLDNLPFRLVIFDGGWREVAVSVGRRPGFEEVTIATDLSLPWLPSTAPHGTRLPVQDDAATWVGDALARLRCGTVIVFDYCTSTTAELIGRPWREWLRTYRAHDRGGHYLDAPGTQDITAQVCLDQLRAPTTIESQAEFLRRFSIADLVDEGRRAWAAAAARPGRQGTVNAQPRTRRVKRCLTKTGWVPSTRCHGW